VGNVTYEATGKNVHAPIPKIQRVLGLDAGKWLPIDLTDSPIANCARYNDYYFNNAYIDLWAPGYEGLQQIIGAADADFTYAWELQNISDFNNARALRAGVFGYITVWAALVCRALKIRMHYVGYVAALITAFETFRGFEEFKNSGLHSTYPWFTSVQSNYLNYLPTLITMLKVDLGANDSESFLKNYYIDTASRYNAWMFGLTFIPGVNVKRLGASMGQTAGSRLGNYATFTRYGLRADIDRALTEAYLNDTSLTGQIAINDPAVGVSCGDTIKLNFLDEVFLNLKAFGVAMSFSPESISYSVTVKRLF